MRRRSNLVLLVLLPAVVALAVPATDVAPATAEVTPPSEVRVAIADVQGLDAVAVTATAHRPDIDGVLDSARVCVTAARTETSREFRDGAAVVVRSRRSEHGCLVTRPTYRFEPMTWTAEAAAEIDTEVWTTVTEEGPQGWRVVDQRSERASATVDLRWDGTGDDEVTPWVRPPQFCYVIPPVCGYGAGAAVSRAAEVSGDIHLGGLGVGLSPSPTSRGSMRWWVGT